jgi:hypothetical protein
MPMVRQTHLHYYSVKWKPMQKNSGILMPMVRWMHSRMTTDLLRLRRWRMETQRPMAIVMLMLKKMVTVMPRSMNLVTLMPMVKYLQM